ncbi:MAG: hypothetical protein GF308_00585 [Candidatus Heimdallarchaeota archaeon]|nr:hypothetical protein [Candidatus Heimdallarchaeota archaeon]
MQQLRIIKSMWALLLFLLLFSFPFSLVQGSNYTWRKGDQFTWESLSGSYDFFENENGTWGYYPWGLSHILDVKILADYPDSKSVLLEEGWAYPEMTSPFKVQQVVRSCDLTGDLNNTDITGLFHFHYLFDPSQNDTYFSGVYPSYELEYRVPHHRFCHAEWPVANELFRETFDDSVIIAAVNSTDFTFRDFLNNCSYTIMGTNNYTEALSLMTPTNHHWSAMFDYSSLLEIRDPGIFTYEVQEANATFDLQYSEGGVLENYLLNSSMTLFINNNYTYHYFNTFEIHLTKRISGTLLYPLVIPASLLGTLTIAIIVLKTRKKYK